MDRSFYESVSKNTAHRPIRDYHAGLVFEHPALLADLMELALNVSDKNHHKACWILELVLEKRIDWLSTFLNRFCETLPHFLHDGAVRSIAKICLFAAIEHSKTRTFLSQEHLKIITEVCFDWLIGETKVASKAYAMRALFETGKFQNWVYAELQVILDLGYAQHSAAYRVAAKEILKKINPGC